MKTKKFDCIRMKRAAQQKIRAAVSGMNRQEEIDFFRAGAQDLEQRIRTAKEALTKGSRTAKS